MPFRSQEARLVYHSHWKLAWKLDNGKSYEAAYVQSKLRELKERLGACQWPGCKVTDLDALELAHIKKTKIADAPRGKRGRANRFWDVKKHPTAYTFFCDHSASDHHQQFDDAREAGVKLGWKPKSLLELARGRGYPNLKGLLAHDCHSP